MPEMPEVATIAKQLGTTLPFSIREVKLSSVVGSILKTQSFSPAGKTISSIDRIGKLMIFNLSDGNKILSHLGMSGSWRISDAPLDVKHNHVQFISSSKVLSYVDPRRFGYMYFLTPEEAKIHTDKLGIDIASKEFTSEYVYNVLKKFPDKKLKPFLLDQKYFAGIGNYIACEICARAGIRPSRRAGKITKLEAQKIVDATSEVISGSLEKQGMTFSGGYVDANGEKGEGVQNLVVFWQDECQMCGGTVKKVTLAQRGTFYCPRCQK